MALTETLLEDATKLDSLIEQQVRIFLDRQPESASMTKRAEASLAGGVTSNWQIAQPQTVWLSHGRGSKVYDVDGNEYSDFHGGYGVMAVGHAHPAIVKAVSERIARGSHFAQPTPDSVIVAEELKRRWGLPQWRFGNSGTEATMDAVHLMRAATGRDRFIKFEGAYHGHHDSVMVSVANEAEEIGDRDNPAGPASGTGLPEAITRLTSIAHFNDIDSVTRVFDDHPGEVAGVLIEPIMMNSGIIPPRDGFIEAVGAVAHRNGALLAFDEVKTGLTVAPGGATEYLGVTPDIVCLAKALGGGLPCGALGGSDEVMGLIGDGTYEQVGTFNGNPLTLAAARATLTEALDDAAYARFDRLRASLVDGCQVVIDRHGLAAHVVSVGAKGCITFRPDPVRNYRDFLAIDDRFSHLHWLFQHNGGVFLPPWGKAEQWLVSAQHTQADTDLFVSNFARMAGALRS